MLTPQQLDVQDLLVDFEEQLEPTKSYIFNNDIDKVIAVNDEIKALEQAILLYTSVERYDHIIYSWNNFIELSDLFGKPTSYVASELPRRITETLLQDERILSVGDFVVTSNKKTVSVAYIVNSIYGDVDAEKEVIYG